jgi:hypothetical protein
MTNEDILAAIKKQWEKDGSKTIEIREGEPVFNAKEFIESLSYSKTPRERRPA